MAANVFMSMVLGGPVRMIVSGNAPDPAEIEDRIRFAVRLFLDGVKTRKDADLQPLAREAGEGGGQPAGLGG